MNIGTYCKQIARVLEEEHLIERDNALNKISFTSNQNVHIERLCFNKINSKVFRNSRPNIGCLEIILDINYSENPQFNSYRNQQAPFLDYNFSLCFLGLTKECQIHETALHIDIDYGINADIYHPLCHLTYGGKNIENKNLGDTLFLPSPRIPIPPMDIILGIDFILSNFLEKSSYDKVWSNSYYNSAVKASQNKYWQPYFDTIIQYWCGNKCKMFPNTTNVIIQSLIPSLR